MSATIVHLSRRDSPINRSNAPMTAEELQIIRDLSSRLTTADLRGSLWERVAETSAQKFRYTWRGGMTRGPRSTLSDRSGIIRAGVRIK